MLPVVLDPSRIDLAAAGRGPELLKRVLWLLDGGAARLAVYADGPGDAPGLAPRLPPGARLLPRLPTPAEVAAAGALWVAGLPAAESAALAAAARAAGTPVNVEDVIDLCDFHVPAVVRRGDLLLSVSTGGKSPGLARRVKLRLEAQFGPEWAGRLDDISRKRALWRRRGRPLPELAALTDAAIDRRGWLAAGDVPGDRA